MTQMALSSAVSRRFDQLRVWCALVALVVMAIVIAIPQYYLLRGWSALTRADGLARCRRTSRWFSFWCRCWLRLYRVIGGVRYRVSLPKGDEYLDGDGPFLAIANHHGAFDAALLCEMGAVTGRVDYRTVAMREVRDWPVVGSILREARFAFMRRSKDPKDVEDLVAFASQVHADGAIAMIFPEGHIYERPKEGSGYTHVLPPKPRGLKAMLECLPGRPILSVTINWHDHDISRAGLLGAIPPGTDVTVTARIVHGITPENVEEWLKNEWSRKDAVLSARR